jgi:hypothetical protein
MPFIPEDAKWYLADIVLEITVEGEDGNIVHINLTLIRADSPEEAYDRAIQVGKESEFTDKNLQGQTIKTTFRGLRNLHVIYEELEDGSEILYEEHLNISREQLNIFIRPKHELSVFRS